MHKFHSSFMTYFGLILVLMCECVSAQQNASWQFESEILKGWVRGAETPPLVSRSAVATTRQNAGVLGVPGSEILFGDSQIGNDHRTGTRFGISRVLNGEDEIGFYANAMYISDDNDQFQTGSGSNGSPILGRPFFNAISQTRDAELVSFPSALVGHVRVDMGSEFYLSNLGIKRAYLRGDGFGLDLTAGYQFLSFRDSLQIREDLRSIDQSGFIPLDTTFMVRDQFTTLNHFHGGKFGFAYIQEHAEWLISAQSSVALGGISRRLKTFGETQVAIPGLPADVTRGGLLVMPTNEGNYRSSTFVAVPEIRLSAERRLNSMIRLTFGYSFLLMPQTWRAAEQIDYRINDSQIGGGTLSGPTNPAFRGVDQAIWLQTVALGGTFQW
jgi:Putative beta barrel porin-7 (BBP7)